jgi:hypothetical protein
MFIFTLGLGGCLKQEAASFFVLLFGRTDTLRHIPDLPYYGKHLYFIETLLSEDGISY